MTRHNHQTAPTPFVEANGIRFAYRRFGKGAGVPLIFNQHFTGTMDHWDPAVTDGFARDREVILFNNAGVSSSSGEVPTRIENGRQRGDVHQGARIDESRYAWLFDRRFCRAGNRSSGARLREAIGLSRHRPARRRGHGHAHARGAGNLRSTYEEPDHLWLRVHFTKSEKSQAAGREFLKRFRLRAANRDPDVRLASLRGLISLYTLVRRVGNQGGEVAEFTAIEPASANF
jgi:hypothetical protein